MTGRSVFGTDPTVAAVRREAFARGARAAGPALVATSIWGLVTGIAMIKTGLTTAQALAMTLFVYAGSAQMAALPLIAADAPVWVVLLTATVVNLRFVIFSATLWTYFGRLPLARRLVLGYLTADIGLALFMSRYGNAPDDRRGNTEQVIALFFASRREDNPGIRFPDADSLNRLPESNKTKWSRRIIVLRALSLFLITFALARPQQIFEESKVKAEGIDMVLSVDISSSMLAEDFKIGTKRMSRIEAAKAVIKDFVRNRKGDRIGMVLSAAKAYMTCPLTIDYDWLLANLERVEVGLIEDNTAIGSGLSSALNRLKTSGSRGKAVILLTDGRNNAGRILAAEALAELVGGAAGRTRDREPRATAAAELAALAILLPAARAAHASRGSLPA